jgi:Fic family protein
MEELQFKSERTGKLQWESQGMHFRFEPKKLPFEIKNKPSLINKLTETAISIGRLDGISNKFNENEMQLLITPFLFKEATISSEIEGTRATLSDVYKSEKEVEQDKEKALDNQEIKNYIAALKIGLEKTKNNPITEEFIKELHKILLTSTRGENKNPGEYKIEQNAIGKSTDTLQTAKFVPASPPSTKYLVKNLVEFLNDNSINPLYKSALLHYQFEAIHPFRDGNGRIGRLLIMLYLCKEGILSQPLLYPSEYFKTNRNEYVDRLFKTSSNGEIEEWLEFFLDALNTQAKRSFEFATKLKDYKKQLICNLREKNKSPHLLTIIDMLFENPYIRIIDIKNKAKVSAPAAMRMIQFLENEMVLFETDKRERNKVFIAREIMKILEM